MVISRLYTLFSYSEVYASEFQEYTKEMYLVCVVLKYVSVKYSGIPQDYLKPWWETLYRNITP